MQVIPKIEGEKKGLLKSLYFQYTKKEKKTPMPPGKAIFNVCHKNTEKFR